jgi:homoserine O-succinyltransferase
VLRGSAGNTTCLEIGLINNLPAASRAAGERQFRRLLTNAAAGGPAFRLRLFSLTARDGEAPAGYEPIGDLWRNGLDAVIVTGAEPTTPDLRDEPYWDGLTDLFDWCAANRIPTLFSCLASHAAVLHADGIARRPLPEKRFGLFRHEIVADHPLTRGVRNPFPVPHSRWNEVDAGRLAAAGYRVITASDSAGVDLFINERHGLSLYCQGHPEYEPETLMLEFRRDVKRFLAGTRDSYPGLPTDYFDPTIAAELDAFRRFAIAERACGRCPDLPAKMIGPDTAPWHAPTSLIVGNWLREITERRG